MTWSVYIVECCDGSLYTGIATDVGARIKKHNAGTGAKYTRSRKPVKLLWSQFFETRSDASKAESRIKRLSRAEKLSLVSGERKL